MSDSTPILTTLSDICACAAPIAPASARASTPSLNALIAFSMVDRWWSGASSVSAGSDAQVIVQLGHVGLERGVRDHVHDSPVLHHIVPVRHGRGEAEILLDQQNSESFLLELADGTSD